MKLHLGFTYIKSKITSSTSLSDCSNVYYKPISSSNPNVTVYASKLTLYSEYQ